MQKIGSFFFLFLLCFVTPWDGRLSCQADDTVSTHPDTKPDNLQIVPFTIDSKREIRLPTPIRIKKVISSTLLLSDTGQIYALTGIDIPDDTETGVKTQTQLSEWTEGQKCTVYQTRSDKSGRINRMNQILAHVTCGKENRWIQGSLISKGLARVRTTPENKIHSIEMLDLEEQARKNKTGLWGLQMNRPLTPLTARQRMDSFGIVEGHVYAVSQNRNAIFLNFTSDWKTDFSIGIPSKLRKDFSKLRVNPPIDPMSLKGKPIRIRGWIRNYNGPYIEMDHVEQLELIKNQKDPVPKVKDEQAN